jgi:hypothetical protein
MRGFKEARRQPAHLYIPIGEEIWHFLDEKCLAYKKVKFSSGPEEYSRYCFA